MNASAETTPERDIGADLPLTQDIAKQSFSNQDELAASLICALSKNSSPQVTKTTKTTSQVPLKRMVQTALEDPLFPHPPSQHITMSDKRQRIENELTIRRVGPFPAGRLKITLYSWVGPQRTAETRADIVLRAPASTIEAIRKIACHEAWELCYKVSVPDWKDGMVFVNCCIEVPTHFMDKFTDILSMVDCLSELPKPLTSAVRRGSIILLDSEENKIGKARGKEPHNEPSYD